LSKIRKCKFLSLVLAAFMATIPVFNTFAIGEETSSSSEDSQEEILTKPPPPMVPPPEDSLLIPAGNTLRRPDFKKIRTIERRAIETCFVPFPKYNPNAIITAETEKEPDESELKLPAPQITKQYVRRRSHSINLGDFSGTHRGDSGGISASNVSLLGFLPSGSAISPCPSESEILFHEEPQTLVASNVIQDPSLFPKDKITKRDISLTVDAPIILETTPCNFTVNASIINNMEIRNAEHLNIYVTSDVSTDVYIIPPAPDMLDLSVLNSRNFSINLRSCRIDSNKRGSLCVYITQSFINPETNEIQEYLVTSHVQEIFLTQSAPNKAIIVVPGICGSELFSASSQRINGRQYAKEYRIWPPEGAMNIVEDASCSCNMFCIPRDIIRMDSGRLYSDFSLISCDDNGRSQAEIMTCNPVENCRENTNNRNFGTINCYKDLIENLCNNSDLQEYKIIFFSYDWRVSNRETAESLRNFIDEKDFTEVVLIAHSMGGLLCSSYLSNPENREKVSKFIALGTPFLGATKAFDTLLEGKFFDGAAGVLSGSIANPIIKNLVKNCPSVYELLPPAQSFSEENSSGYIETFSQKMKFFKKREKSINTYSETSEILQDLQLTFNSERFIRNAQDFHDSLYNYNNKMFFLEENNIQFYNIVGFNSKTLNKIKLKYHHNNFKEVHSTSTANGDGTVTLNSSTINGNSPEETTYYAKDLNHMQLMSDQKVLTLINNILINEPQIFDPTTIFQNLNDEQEFISDGCLPPILRCAAS